MLYLKLIFKTFGGIIKREPLAGHAYKGKTRKATARPGRSHTNYIII